MKKRSKLLILTLILIILATSVSAAARITGMAPLVVDIGDSPLIPKGSPDVEGRCGSVRCILTANYSGELPWDACQKAGCGKCIGPEVYRQSFSEYSFISWGRCSPLSKPSSEAPPTIPSSIQAGEGTVGCTAKSSKISSSIGNGMSLIEYERATNELHTNLVNKCRNVCGTDCGSEIKYVNQDKTYLSGNYELVKDYSQGVIGIVQIDATADCKCSDKPKETTPQKTVCEGLAQEIQDVNEIIRTRMGDVGGYQGHSENRQLGPIDDFTVEIYKELLKNLQEQYKLKCVKTSTQPYIDSNKFPFKEETETSSEDNYKLDWDEQEGFKYKIPLLDSTHRTPCEQRECDYNRAYTSENDPCKGCGGCIPDHEQTQERVFSGPNPGHCSPKETGMLPRSYGTTPEIFEPKGNPLPTDMIIKFPLSERGKQAFEPSQTSKVECGDQCDPNSNQCPNACPCSRNTNGYEEDRGRYFCGGTPKSYMSEQPKLPPIIFEPRGTPLPSEPRVNYPLSEDVYGPKEVELVPIWPEGSIEELIEMGEKQQKQEGVIQKTWKWIKGLFGAGGVLLPEEFNDLPEPVKARIKEFFKNKETGSLIKFDANQEVASAYLGDSNTNAIAITNVPKGKCANNCELKVEYENGKVVSIKVNLQSGSDIVEVDSPKTKDVIGKFEIEKPKEQIKIKSISLVEKDVQKNTDTLISSADIYAKFKITSTDEEIKIIKKEEALPPKIPSTTGIIISFDANTNNEEIAIKDIKALPPAFDMKINDPNLVKTIKIAGKEIGKEYLKKTIRVCIGQEVPEDEVSITEPASDTLAVKTMVDHDSSTKFVVVPRPPGKQEGTKPGLIASGIYPEGHGSAISVWLPLDPPNLPRVKPEVQPEQNGIIASGHMNIVSLAEDITNPPKATNSQPNKLTGGVVRLTGKATSESVDCESIKQQISYGKQALGTAIAQLEKIQQRLTELNKKGQGNSEEARNLINQKNYLQSRLPRLREEINKLEQQYEKECREGKEKTEIVRVPCDVVIPEKDKDKIKDIVITREEDTTPKPPQDEGPLIDKQVCSKDSVPSCQGKREGEICTTEFHTSRCETANIMIKGGGETTGCICPAPSDQTEYELVCPPNQKLVDLGAPGKQCVCKDENYYAKGPDCLSKQKYCNMNLPGSIWKIGPHLTFFCECLPGQEIINNECRGRPQTGQRQQQIIDTPPKTAPTQPPAIIGTPGQTTTQPPSTTTPPSRTTTPTTSTTTVSPPAQQTTLPPSISPPAEDKEMEEMELCPPAQMCPADYYANVLIGCYESYAGVSEVCRQSIGLCSQCPQQQAPQQQKQTTQQECDNLRCVLTGMRTRTDCISGGRIGYTIDCRFSCNLGDSPDYTSKVSNAGNFFNSYSDADIDRVSNDCGLS